MEKDPAQALAELLSGPGVARPINMDKASVNVPRTPPVGGVANMVPVVDAPPTSPVGGVANMSPVVDAPVVDAPPTSPASSTPPSHLLTPRDTCACEEYLEENNQSIKVLVAMCIGLVNDQKQPIMDITQEPWISMKNQNKIKPLNPYLSNEVVRRWETYLALFAGDKTGPHPKSWKTPKLLEWLKQNPLTDFYDVEYLIKMADRRKMLATQANAARRNNEESLDDWKGKVPMLRVIAALVQNDDAKRAFLTRRDIDPGRHAVDGRNSIEKRPLTVWEMISDW
jgi:hypothetical protein